MILFLFWLFPKFKHRESLNKLDQKRTRPSHTIIKMPKLKDKERLLKEAREKEAVTYKGVPMRLSTDFSKENLQARGTGKKY